MTAAADAGGGITGIVRRMRGRLTPLLFAGSAGISAVCQVAAGLLVIKWVTPDELGLWQSARLAQTYAYLLLLGINNGLSRELPFYLGKGETAFAERLAGTAFYFTTLANVLVVCAGIGCAIALAGKGANLVLAILAVTAIIVMGFYQNTLIVTFRSKDSFNKLTVLTLIEAVLNLVTVPLVYYFQYNGLLARTVGMAAVLLALQFAVRPMRSKLGFDRKSLKLLLKTGLPIFGLDYARTSASTLDRLTLLKVGGTGQVGLYAVAGVILQTLSTLTQALASYLYPRMTYRYGETGNARELWGIGIRFAALATGIAALAAVVAWIALPIVVPMFMPKYAGGLQAARIILLAGVFEGATLVANALWSIKAWRLMIIYQLAGALVCAVGPIAGCLLMGASIEGVAWGVVFSSGCRGLLALALGYYGTRRSPA